MGDTILQYFFRMEGVLDEPGTIGWLDIGQQFSLSATSTHANLEFDFVKVTVTDDTSYFAPVNTVYNFTFPTPVQTSTQIPTVLAVCNNTNGAITPRYSHLYWDPTLSALFLSDINDPANNSSNRTVAIAVGVSVGAVVLIVLIIILIYVLVWNPRKQRQSRQKLSNSSQKTQTATL